MATLYIHIGTHKTGTSMIQENLIFNVNYHLKNQILNFLGITEDINTLMTQTEYNENLTNRIIEKFNSQIDSFSQLEYKKYILSFEGLSGDSNNGYKNSKTVAKTLKEVTKKLHNINDVKIIVYLRKQNDYIESLYNQMIKQGNSYTFKEFLSKYDKESFNWELLLNSFEEEFGFENIILKRYDKEYLPYSYSIIDDFYKILEIDDFEYIKEETINPGLSRDAVEILRLVNKELETTEEKKKLRYMLQSSAPKQKGEKFTFFDTDEERVEYLNKYQISNNNIAKKYFNEDILFPKDKKSYDSYKELDSKKIMMILFKIFIKQSNETDTKLYNQTKNIDEITSILKLL